MGQSVAACPPPAPVHVINSVGMSLLQKQDIQLLLGDNIGYQQLLLFFYIFLSPVTCFFFFFTEIVFFCRRQGQQVFVHLFRFSRIFLDQGSNPLLFLTSPSFPTSLTPCLCAHSQARSYFLPSLTILSS